MMIIDVFIGKNGDGEPIIHQLDGHGPNYHGP